MMRRSHEHPAGPSERDECVAARRALASALLGDAVDEAMRAAAEAHVLRCSACAARLHALARAVAAEAVEQLSCAEAGARLATAAHGRPGQALDLDDLTTAHLAACADCAATAAWLERALADVATGRIGVPEARPAFDTSFAADPGADRRGVPAILAGLAVRLREALSERTAVLRGDSEEGRRRTDPSLGLLVPVAVALLFVLAVTWGALRSTRPADLPAPTPTGAAEGRRTSTAPVAGTAGTYGPPGQPTAVPAIVPAGRPSVTASPSPPASATPAPAPAERDRRPTRRPASDADARPTEEPYPPPAELPTERPAYPGPGTPGPEAASPAYPPPATTRAPYPAPGTASATPVLAPGPEGA